MNYLTKFVNYLTCELLDAYYASLLDSPHPKTSGSCFGSKVSNMQEFWSKVDINWAQDKTFLRFMSSNSHQKWKYLAGRISKTINIMSFRLVTPLNLYNSSNRNTKCFFFKSLFLYLNSLSWNAVLGWKIPQNSLNFKVS